MDVIKSCITADVMDRASSDEAHELYGLFDKILKMPVDPCVIVNAKDVHSMVLGKLELVQGATLHTQIVALIAGIKKVKGPRTL